MIRQNIILGDYIFVADLYKAHIDIKDNIYKSEWVMLRHFDIMNTIAYDTDIYFIEKSVLEEAIKDISKKKSTTDKLVFPTIENKYTGYSSNYKDFNDDFNYYSFRLNRRKTLLGMDNDNEGLFQAEEDDTIFELDELIEVNTDIYNLVDKNNNLQKIECDTVRLYHPNSIKKLDAIIYIDNYINNKHFHYYCQKYENLKSNSETEFEEYHNRYSEYVEFHIPNIEYLFGEDNVYFNEDLNLVYKEVVEDTTESYTQWDNKLWEVVETELIPDKYNNYFFTIETENGKRNAQFTFKHEQLKPLDEPCIYGQYYTYINGKNANNEYLLYYDEELNKYTLYINENCNITWQNNIYSRIPAEYNYVSFVYYDTEDEEGDSNIYYERQLAHTETNVIEKYKNITDSLVQLNTLLLPFTIEKDRDVNSYTYGHFLKHYIEEKQNIWTNYISWPINITLYPYDYLDDKSNIYIMREYINSNSDTFQSGCRFSIKNKFGFADGIISLINIFDYPNIDGDLTNIKDAYKLYNNVTENDYTENNKYFYEIEDKDEDEQYEPESKIHYCGYKIEIATDIYFKNIIYEYEENLDFIDDFSFQLNGLFEKWEELPEVLVLRSKFIDKYLCSTIFSNFILFTKEWFKYLINTSDIYRLKCLVDRQESEDIEGKRRYLYWDGQYIDEHDKVKVSNGPSNLIWNKIYKSILNTDDSMNTDYFNYIDKINCIIKTKDKDDNTSLNSNNAQQILYKPIFYKVADAQNIKIRERVTQNIGINLGAYMNKVETFYLTIDNIKYEEYGRNDIFVLFRINAIDLNNSTGKYDISDENGEYITTGIWSIY